MPAASQHVEHVREHARPIAVADDRARCVAGVFVARLTTFGTLPVVMYADDDAHGFGGDRLLRLIGRAADVMGAVDVRQREQSGR